MPRRIDLPCEELRERYAAGQSTIALAQHFHCSPTTIASALRRCGAELQRARFRSSPVAEAALREQYVILRLPIAQIAAYFGVSASTIGNKRRLYGIPPRSRRV